MHRGGGPPWLHEAAGSAAGLAFIQKKRGLFLPAKDMEMFCAHVAAGKPLQLPRRVGYVLLIRQAALASPSGVPMRLMVQCDDHPPMQLCVLRAPERAQAAVALVLSSENSATLTTEAHAGGKPGIVDVLGMWVSAAACSALLVLCESLRCAFTVDMLTVDLCRPCADAARRDGGSDGREVGRRIRAG